MFYGLDFENHKIIITDYNLRIHLRPSQKEALSTFHFSARLHFINSVDRKLLNYRNPVLVLFTIKLSKKKEPLLKRKNWQSENMLQRNSKKNVLSGCSS